MKVLFRAEVDNIEECHIKLLSKINNKFYAIGFEIDLDGEYGITTESGHYFKCKKNTRSIHFEDMLDSETNPIFASFSESRGKGGDIMQHPNSEEESGFNTFVVIYDRWQIKAKNDKYGLFGFRLASDNKVIGIQQ